MDAEDIDALLTTVDHGVLALAADDVPYTIPVSFGYEDGNVYFAFVRKGSESEKFDVIEDGKTARLLVTDIKARFDWQSVAVSGAVEPIDLTADDWEILVDSLENNPWFSTAFADVEGVRGWRLTPDEISGLEVRPVSD